MRSLMTRLALSFTLILTFASNAFAASIDYPQTGPFFTESAYLVGGGGEVDTFYFTNQTEGLYHFYSTGTTDVYGYIYSDTYATTLTSNDDGAGYPNFCVDAYLLAGENISIVVDGWSTSSEGDYTVNGASDTCLSAGMSGTNSGYSAPTASSAAADEASALSLPLTLFAILGLAAVRLRRFFA